MKEKFIYLAGLFYFS